MKTDTRILIDDIADFSTVRLNGALRGLRFEAMLEAMEEQLARKRKERLAHREVFDAQPRTLVAERARLEAALDVVPTFLETHMVGYKPKVTKV